MTHRADQAGEAERRDYVQRLLHRLDRSRSRLAAAAPYSSVHSPAIGEGK